MRQDKIPEAELLLQKVIMEMKDDDGIVKYSEAEKPDLVEVLRHLIDDNKEKKIEVNSLHLAYFILIDSQRYLLALNSCTIMFLFTTFSFLLFPHPLCT